MDPFPINLLGRKPIRKRINYVHKDQLAFYGSEDPDYSCAQFRTCYRFQENTVRWLAMKLEDDIGPIAYTNNALMLNNGFVMRLGFIQQVLSSLKLEMERGLVRAQCTES